MLRHLSTEDMRTLAALARSPFGISLTKVLREDLAHADERLRAAQGEEVFRAQGRAQAIAELIERLVRAPQKADSALSPTKVATSRFGATA